MGIIHSPAACSQAILGLCFRFLWEVRCYYRPRIYSDLCCELAETIESDTPTGLGVSKMSLICCKAPALSWEPRAWGWWWVLAQPLEPFCPDGVPSPSCGRWSRAAVAALQWHLATLVLLLPLALTNDFLKNQRNVKRWEGWEQHCKVLLPQQSLPGCWKLSGRATYLHCLQHLVVRELGSGVPAALCTEHSLDYFVSIPFKLGIKEESRCVRSLCAIPWHLHGFTETVLSGLGKGLVNDDVESVYVKSQAVWASLKVLW